QILDQLGTLRGLDEADQRMRVFARFDQNGALDLVFQFTALQRIGGNVAGLDLDQLATVLAVARIGQVKASSKTHAGVVGEQRQFGRIEIDVNKIFLAGVGRERRIEAGKRLRIVDVMLHEI